MSGTNPGKVRRMTSTSSSITSPSVAAGRPSVSSGTAESLAWSALLKMFCSTPPSWTRERTSVIHARTWSFFMCPSSQACSGSFGMSRRKSLRGWGEAGRTCRNYPYGRLHPLRPRRFRGTAELLRGRLECRESLLLLHEVLLEQVDGLVLAERSRQVDHAGVRGDLVVLRPRAGTGEEQVAHLRPRIVPGHERVLLGLDALDSRASLGLRGLAEQLEHLLEVLDVLSGLLQVLLETRSQRLVAGLLGQLRQGLGEQLLREQQVPELVDEQLAWLGQGWHDGSFRPFVRSVSDAFPGRPLRQTAEAKRGRAAVPARPIGVESPPRRAKAIPVLVVTCGHVGKTVSAHPRGGPRGEGTFNISRRTRVPEPLAIGVPPSENPRDWSGRR